jgi:chromosome transmission fidelity protein 18
VSDDVPSSYHILTQCRPLDNLTSFYLGKVSGQAPAPVRYAIRQVLDQELRKERILMSHAASRARSTLLDSHFDNLDADKENANAAIAKKEVARLEKANTKRDFFGRIINDARPSTSAGGKRPAPAGSGKDEKRVWVSFHEGYSNAVRKPITLEELMESFA